MSLYNNLGGGCSCSINWQKYYEDKYRELLTNLEQKLFSSNIELSILKTQVDAAMKVLNPNMPESGIEDAARQVKQVAMTATELYQSLVKENEKLNQEMNELALGNLRAQHRAALENKRLADQLSSAIKSYQEATIDADGYKDEIENLEAELEIFKARRVPCSCGKDTADIKYAQCYNCRQALPNEVEILKADLEKTEALLGSANKMVVQARKEGNAFREERDEYLGYRESLAKIAEACRKDLTRPCYCGMHKSVVMKENGREKWEA